MFSSGKSNFDKLLDAATSPMLLEPNWEANLEVCDSIRQGDVTSKYAVSGLQKRMKDPRPLVSKYALVVLETCVKNCGQPFHEEISNPEFLEDMKNLARTGSAPVKDQVLSMLQAWNHAFRNKTQYQPILATYNLLKMEGFKFPPLSESDAMFSADAAPTWKEGDVCHMCRVKFSLTTRQHHCRACGEVFCKRCSSKNSIIPKIGIEREVRVCDHCYDEINPNAGQETTKSNSKVEDDSELPAEYLNSDLAKESQTKPQLSEAEVKAQEEEEMQLALALSLSEEEANKKTSGKNWTAPTAPVQKTQPENAYAEVKSVLKSSSESKSNSYTSAAASLQSMQTEDTSSELSKYLDRSYWEKKNAENKSRMPSAPVVNPVDTSVSQSDDHHYDEIGAVTQENDFEEENNSAAFVETMEKSIEMFIDRMNTVRYKGKHIAMDSTVQSLFQSLSAMHPQLIKLIEDEEESKAKYEAMLQKLAVIREARESLNDMRAQHREKMRHQELEQEMLRRMQMEQKLELMRQQKQEYLEYQRQLQIQRQQELEVYQQEKLMGKQQMPGYPGIAQPVSSTYEQYPMVPSGPKDVPSQPYGRPPQYPGHAQQYLPRESTSDTSVDANIVPPPSYDHATTGKSVYSQVPNSSSIANSYYQSQPPIHSQSQIQQRVTPQLENQRSPQHMQQPANTLNQPVVSQQILINQQTGLQHPQTSFQNSNPPPNSMNQPTYQSNSVGPTYQPQEINSNLPPSQQHAPQVQSSGPPPNQAQQNMNPQNVNPQIMNPQNMNPQNVNSQTVNPQNQQFPQKQYSPALSSQTINPSPQPQEFHRSPQPPSQQPLTQPQIPLNNQTSPHRVTEPQQNQQQYQQINQPPVQQQPYQNQQPGQPPMQIIQSSQHQQYPGQPVPQQTTQTPQPPPTQHQQQIAAHGQQQPLQPHGQQQQPFPSHGQPLTQNHLPSQQPNDQPQFQQQNFQQQQNFANDPNMGYQQQPQQQQQYYNQPPSANQQFQPQQNYPPPQNYQLPPQQQSRVEELSSNMKDLQLISFE